MNKWHMIFISETEKYGLATEVNGCLQLVCRGMVRPMAERLAEILNAGAVNAAREHHYSRD